MSNEVLQTVTSVHGHTIRITIQQWAHITESHDYMAGNLDKVAETLAEPSRVIQGEQGEFLALRDYVVLLKVIPLRAMQKVVPPVP